MGFRSNSKRWPTPDQLRHWHGVKFYLSHIYESNDPDGTRREPFKHHPKDDLPKYVSYCAITTGDGKTVLAEDWAIVSPRDTPNRRLGHEIAVTRAIAQYMEDYGKDHPVNAFQKIPPKENMNEGMPDSMRG